MKKAMNTAVIGCGMISEIYLKNLTKEFDNICVCAVCDLDEQKAKKRSEQFNVPARTMQEILEDKDIELVIVLTPVPTHYGIIKQALLAGKHVYTEKTMTVTLAEAKELVELAKEKGVYLGAAPDTFLGASLQEAKHLIASGAIGKVTSFIVCANSNIDYVSSRFKFVRLPGSGICYDYGVYYITALVSLLGAFDNVVAKVGNPKPIRVNIIPDDEEYGKEFKHTNETQAFAMLTTKNGVTGTFTLNGESMRRDHAVFTIYGTEGILELANPNFFGGELTLISGALEWEPNKKTIISERPFNDNNRGLGPSEMVDAIFEGRENRASSQLALHVLDTIESMIESSNKGTYVKVRTECDDVLPL